MNRFWIVALSVVLGLGVFLAAEAGPNRAVGQMGPIVQNQPMGTGMGPGFNNGPMNGGLISPQECLDVDWSDEEYWAGFGMMHGPVGSQGKTDTGLVPDWMVGFMQMMGGMMEGCW